MANPFALGQPAASTTGQSTPFPRTKPTVIGLYGLPGSGKTTLLEKLKTKLCGQQIRLYEGSNIIECVCLGGIEAFKQLGDDQQNIHRKQAIEMIAQECKDHEATGVVTGHLMFWRSEVDQPHSVWTQADGDNFTHILYLDLLPETISHQSQFDPARERQSVSLARLTQWVQTEKSELRRLCYDNKILFSTLSSGDLLEEASNAICHFALQDESLNSRKVIDRLEEIIGTTSALKRMLVFDADKTLSAADTGELF